MPFTVYCGICDKNIDLSAEIDYKAFVICYGCNTVMKWQEYGVGDGKGGGMWVPVDNEEQAELVRAGVQMMRIQAERMRRFRWHRDG